NSFSHTLTLRRRVGARLRGRLRCGLALDQMLLLERDLHLWTLADTIEELRQRWPLAHLHFQHVRPIQDREQVRVGDRVAITEQPWLPAEHRREQVEPLAE